MHRSLSSDAALHLVTMVNHRAANASVYASIAVLRPADRAAKTLSKGRMAELPKSVGPGPMGLVLKEVLTLLINVAYKSCKVLKELQLEGPPNPNMEQQVLKAKYVCTEIKTLSTVKLL